MRRIALYYPMRIGLWQSVLRGIFQFARPHQPWVFSLAVREDPAELLAWKPDAVIGQIETSSAVGSFEQLTIPVIDTSFSFHQLDVPRVRFHDEDIGRRAAIYLVERGYQHIGFVGNSQVAFEQARKNGFRGALGEAGVQELVTPELARGEPNPDDLGPVDEAMVEWLRHAPRPLALFAAVDPLALRLSEACRAIGLRVPDDVALLGVNNDELICNLASPPLSSVRLPARRLGFEAAKLTADWLETNQRPNSPPMLCAIDIVTRQSTDIYATADEVLNRALHFIRDHANARISVQNVVESLDISRSSLERRFKAILRRSPLDEIRRVQFLKAKRLLVDTNRTMPEIAIQSGFRDGKHFATAFRSAFGLTPTEFRRMQ